MVLESFGNAPMKAKVLNLSVLLLSLFALIGTLVGFAGDLFRSDVQIEPGITKTWYFYQSHIQTDSSRLEYNDSVFCFYDFCNSCLTGGRGFLAMQVLAFLVLIALTCVTTFRIFGGIAINALAHPARSLFVESWLSCTATFFYFLSVCVYGGTCLKATQHTDRFSVAMSGFAYVICCFFFLVIQIVLFYVVRKDESAHLGATTTGTFDGSYKENFMHDDDEEYRRVDSSQGYGSYQTEDEPQSGAALPVAYPPSNEAFQTKKTRGQR